MNIRRQPLTLVFLILYAAFEASLGAQPSQGATAPRQGGVSEEKAAQLARQRTGGRVLSVKPTKDGYRVKVLTPRGEVRYVPIRAGKP